MHPNVRIFIEDVAAAVQLPDPIVEFGSMQVEAEQEGDLRALFAGRDFLGTDFREGPGVDRVEDLRSLTFGDGEVGTAICLETLEHCEDPIAACRELHRVVADGGVCVISAPMLLGIHGYPNDYFRYTPSGFRVLLGAFDDAWAAGLGSPDHPLWVFGVAAKGRRLDLSWERLPRLAEAQREWERAEGKFIVGPLQYESGDLVRIAARELPRAVAERARNRVAQALIRTWIADLAAAVELPDPIVEFGSMQVEAGQDGDLRALFAGREFLGTDFREGPGVDRVEDLRSLTFGDGEVGTALCLDTLEHCEDPIAACRELHRVTAPGGVCAISSVMLFGIHGYPDDYFRFTPEAFRSLLGGFDDVWVAGIGDPEIPMQVVGVGAKGRTLDLSLASFPSLAAAQRDWEQARGTIRLGPFRARPGELLGLMLRQAPRTARDALARRRAARRSRTA